MRYLIIIEKTDTGFSAYVPDLPGCVSVGETRLEIESNIQEAILFHLEGLKEDGIDAPTPTSEGISLIIPNVA